MALTKNITLKSLDVEAFEVEEAVAVKSQMIKHMIEDNYVDNKVPLPNATNKILAEVIKYCKKHVDANCTDEKPSEDELKAWEADFVKVDQEYEQDFYCACGTARILAWLPCLKVTSRRLLLLHEELHYCCFKYLFKGFTKFSRADYLKYKSGSAMDHWQAINLDKLFYLVLLLRWLVTWKQRALTTIVVFD
ncbi:SKP1-like protein 1A [Glycine soja]|uniref:SKP1-like protein 1A n=1 Tax=Glycine soja TaxID=3848 RepID=A0A445EYW1_GLYSO|nr:SKP1-like protein 1A [Glycine soja]